MKTEDLIRYVLIAVGAYLIYQWWQKSSVAVPAGRPAVPPPGPAPGAQPPAQQPPTQQPAAPNEAARIKALAEADFGPNPSLTADQWNFYAASVLQRTMPAPEDFGFTGAERSRAVQFDTYWTRLVGSKLIAGLGWLGISYAPAGWGAGLSAWMEG